MQKKHSNTSQTVRFRSMKNYSKDNYIEALNKVNFPNYLESADVDSAYSDFSERLLGVINLLAPIKNSRIKTNNKEWYDGEVAELISSRNNLFQKFKKSRLEIDKQIYHEARNKVLSVIKKKKTAFFENKLKDNVGQPRKLWEILKNLGLGKKKTPKVNVCLEDENKNKVFDPKQNATIFKDFYSNLANNLVQKLPIGLGKFGLQSVKTYYSNKQVHKDSFSFKEVSESDVLKALNDIETNKAAGSDKIQGIFLKDGAEVLSQPISELINLSLKTSVFPKDCKIAKLVPLHKKGSKTDPKNYRPISLLPLLSKIFEKVVHQQMQNFLDQNSIIYAYQSGFRPKYSTDCCLSLLNDKILKGYDDGFLTGMILIDLQKAFDTIDYQILLEKMKHMGFSDSTVQWFKSYLINRQFFVAVGDTSSENETLNCGVPQGSILGPLLFLLYVNDMKQAVDCDLLLYADDSCLIYQHKSEKEIEKTLTQNFKNICEWFVDNKLSIHFGEDKTKCILFCPKSKLSKANKLNIEYEGKTIKQYSKVTYLGCILDETLSGESMALQVISKINKRLKFLYRNRDFLTPSLRRMLCNSLLQPHFDYACSAWYPNLNKCLKTKLQIVQNKCIRFCLQSGYRKHIGVREFEAINWLPVGVRFEQCVNTHVYKCYHKLCPDYMSEIFSPAKSSERRTRSSSFKLTRPFRKSVNGQKALSFLGPSFWNSLPNSIKESSSVNSFKHRLKEHYFISLKCQESDEFLWN